MARLRRDSSESYKGDSGVPRQLADRKGAGLRTRTSPRKKIVESYTHFDEIDEGTELDRGLTVKTSVNGGKQIRLAPRATLASRTAKLEFDLSTKLYGLHKGRPEGARPLESSCTANKVQCKWLPAISLSVDGLAAPDDVEESVICDSNASATEDEDDELPSPRKFINLQTKSQKIGSTRIEDLADDLNGLRISRAVVPKPVVANQPVDPIALRPTSSSDKENDDRALLRFSPPRLHPSPRKQRSPERAHTPPPTSPSKGKLQSPSKSRMRIPTPPLRPSLDAFWDAETVNDWNDQYSPKKEWNSPRKLMLPDQGVFGSPTASPRKLPPSSPSKRNKTEIAAKKDWESRKYHIAEAFLAELNRALGDGQIQELAASTGGVRIIWSKTLNSTAGRANWKRETTRTHQSDGSVTITHKHHASIELAAKVIDDETRLLNVVAHEFCHLCNFMISGIKDQPHGKQFKEWGRLATKAFGSRGVEVTTKHAYQIAYKFVWRCENDDCGVEFKRHSKSIDPARQTCGACRGKLVQIKPVPRKADAGGGSYATFVKNQFKEVKKSMPGASQKEIMEAIGQRYRTQKPSREGGVLDLEVKRKTSSSLLGDQALMASDPAEPSSDGVDVQMDKVSRVLEFIVLDD